jgi:hypothetical protein
MGKASRDKGKRGELEACEALAEVWPGLKRQYGQARMHSSTPDIDGPGCPVFIEVKRQESINVHKAMEQANASSTFQDPNADAPWMYQPRPPVIVHKRNRGEWLVTVRARDLKRILK